MNGKKLILVCFHTDETHKELLLKYSDAAEFVFLDEEAEIAPEQLRSADAIFGNPAPKLLKEALKLEWLQLCSAGADRYVGGVLPKGITLTNASGAYGPSIAEYMVCAAMSLLMDLPVYRDHQKEHLWQSTHRMRHLDGTLALSVGFGNIGREFGKRYHALGGHVVGVKRTAGEVPEYADEVRCIGELDSLIPQADVVALSLPSTSDTRRMFGAERFSLMKKGSILINVGRGTAVDQAALYDALVSGSIGGAALDVTEPEPLPADSPLWDCPSLILTPHVSGGWWVPENYERVFSILLDNLGRYLRDEPLRNRVNLETGY